MRVLIIQPWISYRGSETVSLLEAYHLPKLGVETAIVCLFVDWERVDPRYQSVKFILPPPFLARLFASSKVIVGLLGGPVLLLLVLLHMRFFDVLNPHNLPASWVCALVKHGCHARVVWTVHGVPKRALQQSSFFEKLVWVMATGRIDQWAVRQVDQIISVSNKVAREVRERYARKSAVIYPPVDIENYVAGDGLKIRQRFAIKSDEFLLLHVSYLHPAKNVELSIRTLAKILPDIPTAKLLIVGEGQQRRELELLATRLSLGARVLFAGFIDRRDLQDYYHAADLLVVPFWQTEGCSLVVFEGLAAGLVSVVVRKSGADEIVKAQEIGIVAEANSARLAEAIVTFYHSQTSRQNNISRGRKYIKENLSGMPYTRRLVTIMLS